jgi:exonuclease III
LNSLKKKFQARATIAFQNTHLSYTTIKIPYTKEWLPGGTFIMTSGKYTGQISQRIKDNQHMGRWTGTVYNVGDNKKIHIVSAYCVCNTKVAGTHATSSYAQQQVTMGTALGIQQPQPRQMIIDDFIMQFKNICINTQDYFILMIDANETMGEDTNGLTKLAKECNLIDAYEYIHGADTKFPTYERGSKRIDYFLCTPNVLQFITKIGYAKFNEALEGDHRAIFCDLNKKIFDKDIIDHPPRMQTVGTNSTNQEGTN